MQIYFLTKTKIENWQKTAKLTFLCYDILVKKGSLHRNGNAAIPKIQLTNYLGDHKNKNIRKLSLKL